MLVRDTRPVECKLYDRDDKLAGTVQIPPKPQGAEPRRIQYNRKTYLEGDGSGFYGENEFAELVEATE